MGRLAYVLIIISFVVIYINGEGKCFEIKHHNNDELAETLEEVHQMCPNTTRVYALSEKSVMGRKLTILNH